MTNIELCQRLRQEAGIAGSGPSTVVSQSGELERVVSWINSAYEDIQNIRATWRFLQESFTFSTIDGTQNYTPSDVSLSDLSAWKTDCFTLYSSESDEQDLTYLLWKNFKRTYIFGANRSVSTRPTMFTVKPDNSVSLWAIPDAVYTVTGEYYKKAQSMSANDDEPLIPSQFHMIIVWKALMLYGAYSGASDVYTHGEREYKNYLRKLEADQLPKITFGEPLA